MNFVKTVEVTLGPDSVKFLIHRDVLCEQSPFFSAALNSGFQEGITQKVHLPTIEARHFEHAVLWFYAQRLESREFFFKDDKPTYFTLLDLYRMADQLLMEAMRNAIVDLTADLAESTNSVPTPADTTILYERIRDGAPIRKLVLDLFAFKKTENLIVTHPDEWHPKFIRDLVFMLKTYGSHVEFQRRHDLRQWRPTSWQSTKACEACKQLLRPMINGNMCVGCEQAFCSGCMARLEATGSMSGVANRHMLDWGAAERKCKPWIRGICGYHEHIDTEECRGR
jgi:BTB/POZ domain